MRSVTLWQIEMWPWYALGIVWAIAATRDKPDRATEPLPARLLDVIYVGFALALLFSHVVPGKVLYQRFLPSSEELQWLGVVLTYAGAGVAIWARVALGDNWSSRVNVKVGHQLVHSGPYAYVRHPIYSGFLLAMAGTALEVGEWRGLVATILAAVAQSLKAKREEQFMTAEFGDCYAQYQQTTGFLVPKIWGSFGPAEPGN